jgi:hypothetical protein
LKLRKAVGHINLRGWFKDENILIFLLTIWSNEHILCMVNSIWHIALNEEDGNDYPGEAGIPQF